MPLITPYRLAAILLLVFCTLHTLGGMLHLLGPPLPSHALTVLDTMRSVSFSFNGSTATWYNFWFGFGLASSINQLLSTAIAWQLDKVPPEKEKWEFVSGIAWSLVLAHTAGTVLSFVYFFPMAGALSTVVTGLLAYGAWEKGTNANVAAGVGGKKKE